MSGSKGRTWKEAKPKELGDKKKFAIGSYKKNVKSVNGTNITKLNYTSKGNQFNLDDLKKGLATLKKFFSECSSCKYEILSLAKKWLNFDGLMKNCDKCSEMLENDFSKFDGSEFSKIVGGKTISDGNLTHLVRAGSYLQLMIGDIVKLFNNLEIVDKDGNIDYERISEVILSKGKDYEDICKMINGKNGEFYRYSSEKLGDIGRDGEKLKEFVENMVIFKQQMENFMGEVNGSNIGVLIQDIQKFEPVVPDLIEKLKKVEKLKKEMIEILNDLKTIGLIEKYEVFEETLSKEFFKQFKESVKEAKNKFSKMKRGKILLEGNKLDKGREKIYSNIIRGAEKKVKIVEKDKKSLE